MRAGEAIARKFYFGNKI